MKNVVISKANTPVFISSLLKTKKVVAPVAKQPNSFTFEEISNPDQIALSYIPTILPPKKYFMPQHETLAEFSTKDGQNMQAVVEYEEMVIFGVHTCDLAGIQCLNTVFSDRPKDMNYLIRKEHIILIGLECNDYCDGYASCGLMQCNTPNGGYDLFMTDLGTDYLVHVSTDVGDNLISDLQIFSPATSEHLKALDKLRKKKKRTFKNETNVALKDIPKLLEKSSKSAVWDDIGARCLSCGNCTNVCPTCYCFDVKDELNLDLITGKRVRVWDSCQNESFAKVAGGESFRKTRAMRKKHRFHRKFSYPVQRYGKSFCTGCGRCSRTCMAGIDLKETLNKLAAEHP